MIWLEPRTGSALATQSWWCAFAAAAATATGARETSGGCQSSSRSVALEKLLNRWFMVVFGRYNELVFMEVIMV